MYKLAQITFGLALAASPLAAQTAVNAAPIPGPYQVIIQPRMPMPAFNQQRFAPPVPYWMRTQPRPTMQTTDKTAPKPQAPAVSRAVQQPAQSGFGWAPASQQGGNPNMPAPAPGYFPGYTAGQQPLPPRPAPNYRPAYPAAPNYQNYAGQPWGQPWGQQGFMPMGGPWGNGWNGNGWNGNGNGFPQGYPMQQQQQR